jgi:hypothetical protein
MMLRYDREARLRPYTLKEFAILYGVDRKTVLKWLKPLEEELGKEPHEGRYYSIPQVRIIFTRYGIPGTITDE